MTVLYVLMSCFIISLQFYEVAILFRGNSAEKFQQNLDKNKEKMGEETAITVTKVSIILLGAIITALYIAYHSVIIMLADTPWVSAVGTIMIFFAIYNWVFAIHITKDMKYRRPFLYEPLFLFETAYLLVMFILIITGTIG